MTVHPPEPGSGWDVTDHADTIRRALPDADGGAPYAATEALDALLVERQQLQEEVERLRDRAVCSGCGQDVDEAGACNTKTCEDGEMIPASGLPGALLEACEKFAEERDEWRAEVRKLSASWDKISAERQQAIGKLWEQTEAAANLLTEVERLEAERQQAQEDLQHRDAQIQELCDELREAIDQRQQAIDALRRIANGDVHGETRYDDWFKALQVAEEAARAALVKLEEKPQ